MAEVGKMAINVAVERLIAQSGNWTEEASIVITYGIRLKPASAVSVEGSAEWKSSGDLVSGFSPGRGEVSYKESEHEVKRSFVHGIKKDRIGYFRLWKDREGTIAFHYFWKSGITTRELSGVVPDEYYLGYDTRTHQPTYFAVLRKKSFVFQFGLTFVVNRHYLERIHGTGVMPAQRPGLEVHKTQ